MCEQQRTTQAREMISIKYTNTKIKDINISKRSKLLLTTYKPIKYSTYARVKKR